MSNWQVGDLALCIKLGPWTNGDGEQLPAVTIRCGGLYTVRRVVTCFDATALWLNEWPGDADSDGYLADRFIKVTPPKTKQSIRTEQTA